MKSFKLFFSLFTLLLVSSAFATVPQLINFQGRLTDSLGNAVSDGSYSLRFRIYDDSLAGNVLWEETDPVQITKGLFTVLLGSTTSIPDSAFYSANRWLGIKVGTNTEIAPRQRLSSVGYAFQSGQWNSSGNNIYRDSGNVGIGTSSPTAKLDVGGILLVNPYYSFVGVNRSIPVTGQEYFGILAPVGDANYGGMYISTGGNDGWPFYGYKTLSRTAWTYLDGQTGSWKLNNNGDRVTVTSNGDVGIGTSFPGARLAVISSTNATIQALSSAGDGIYASSPFNAGFFQGNVTVTGTLSKGGGAFKIDHPLDPANKYLYHSFVESPDMMNIYNGNITLDAKGEAAVQLPDWFGSVNGDFRYQLTAIGAPGPNLFIAEEISDNQFKIAGGTAGMKVSWQVTGIRQDAWAKAHRIQVEVEKSDSERGKYLHPKELGLSETLGMHYEMTKKLEEERKQQEEQRAKMEQELKGTDKK